MSQAKSRSMAPSRTSRRSGTLPGTFVRVIPGILQIPQRTNVPGKVPLLREVRLGAIEQAAIRHHAAVADGAGRAGSLYQPLLPNYISPTGNYPFGSERDLQLLVPAHVLERLNGNISSRSFKDQLSGGDPVSLGAQP